MYFGLFQSKEVANVYVNSATGQVIADHHS